MNSIVTVDIEPRLPAASPYARCVVAGDWVFLHGQTGIDPATARLVPGGVIPETRQILGRSAALLAAADTTLEQVVKLTCYLARLDDLEAMNTVFLEFFPDCRPVRTVIGVNEVHGGAAVEIDGIAYRGPRQ